MQHFIQNHVFYDFVIFKYRFTLFCFFLLSIVVVTFDFLVQWLVVTQYNKHLQTTVKGQVLENVLTRAV